MTNHDEFKRFVQVQIERVDGQDQVTFESDLKDNVKGYLWFKEPLPVWKTGLSDIKNQRARSLVPVSESLKGKTLLLEVTVYMSKDNPEKRYYTVFAIHSPLKPEEKK